MASLSSENPYATIRDLPSLPGGLRESSYVEMKGPPSGSPPRQPLQLRVGLRQQHCQSQRDSGTYEQPNPLTHGELSLSPERTGREVRRDREREQVVAARARLWSETWYDVGEVKSPHRACFLVCSMVCLPLLSRMGRLRWPPYLAAEELKASAQSLTAKQWEPAISWHHPLFFREKRLEGEVSHGRPSS
jgi:hypothetical protein